MRVAAIVVTYQRPELLKECLEALFAQTEPPAAIMVFDNGSASPKPAVLESTDPRLMLYVCPANSGSAGGFYYAMKEAFRLGYDAVWMMDDDGAPAADALEVTVRAAKGGMRAATSMVLRRDQPDLLTFAQLGLPGPSRVEDFLKYADEKGVVRDALAFYNGTFITRAAYDIVGDVKAECFIWGDEMDLQRRVYRAIPESGTLIAAHHFHPAPREQSIEIRPRRWLSVAEPPRLFILARNQAYNGRFNPRRRSSRLLTDYFAYGWKTYGFATAFKLAAYVIDGWLDTYRLAPSRRELRSRLDAVRRVR